MGGTGYASPSAALQVCVAPDSDAEAHAAQAGDPAGNAEEPVNRPGVVERIKSLEAAFKAMPTDDPYLRPRGAAQIADCKKKLSDSKPRG